MNYSQSQSNLGPGSYFKQDYSKAREQQMVRNQKILIDTQNRQSEASELARAKKQ